MVPSITSSIYVCQLNHCFKSPQCILRMARFTCPQFPGTVYHDGEGRAAGARCLISLRQWSGNRERWMPMLVPLLLFHSVRAPGHGMLPPCSGWIVSLLSSNPDNSSQACPEVCNLGGYRSCQVENQCHSTCAPRFPQCP